MENEKNSIHSHEYMKKMAALMSEAMETPEGMRALAAAIAAPIDQQIKRKEITPLLLSRHVLPVGERAEYDISPDVDAYWVAEGGEARKQEMGRNTLEVPTNRIHATPMVDVSVLKHGNIGKLADVQRKAADAIRKAKDRRTVEALSAAVPAANTVEIAGTTLTDAALHSAIAILEDMELTPRMILMRGIRYNDMRGWTSMSDTTKAQMEKGIVKQYGGAGILLSASMKSDEVIILPDEEIGKQPVRETLKAENLEEKLKWKVGWLVWEDTGMGITDSNKLAKVKLGVS